MLICMWLCCGCCVLFLVRGSIINQDIDAHITQRRSFLDKLIEYAVKDGPNHRYALICPKCYIHNGLVSRDDINIRMVVFCCDLLISRLFWLLFLFKQVINADHVGVWMVCALSIYVLGPKNRFASNQSHHDPKYVDKCEIPSPERKALLHMPKQHQKMRSDEQLLLLLLKYENNMHTDDSNPMFLGHRTNCWN